MHNPFMMVLLETKVTEHAKITKDLVFDAQIQSAAEGLLGSIVIMWKEDLLKLDNIYVSP
ncbi:hypothetical protein R3W88_001277 [Solanum pinnatisectum]|uniref:Uncharacterized protein n=1 Tax=Solanum pinnatisectum TaxID=50273 RepID=A0AAV9MKL4_9SOLN|nr:hypothetical protein R3W88_001277 [Solanum pinnatisectum]